MKPGTSARRQPLLICIKTMTRVGWSMMTYNRLRLSATVLGVVFATVLANQCLSLLLGILNRNAALVRNTHADLGIVPAGTEQLSAGKTVPMAAIYGARMTRGVAVAAPLIMAGGSIKLPNGGAEPLSLIGTAHPRYLGGPWNLVAGSMELMQQGGHIIVEDSERSTLGGLNLGSRREINGQLTTVAGFTWGVTTVAAAYGFVEFDYARELARVPNDQATFGLVQLDPGSDAALIQRSLEAAFPEVSVYTRQQLDSLITRTFLTKTPIGFTFTAMAAFGIVIGFIIVSLMIFSAVTESLREFGTLKAMGARTLDLTIIMLAQAAAYGLTGAVLGLGAVCAVAQGIATPKVAMFVEWWMIAVTLVVMPLMCAAASVISLVKLWRVEPGMVFR